MGGPREIEAFSNFPAYRATLLFNTFVEAKSPEVGYQRSHIPLWVRDWLL
jgi:hypothetical protein